MTDDHYDYLFAKNDVSVTNYLQSALFDLTTFEAGTDNATEKINRALDLLRAIKATWNVPTASTDLTPESELWTCATCGTRWCMLIDAQGKRTG